MLMRWVSRIGAAVEWTATAASVLAGVAIMAMTLMITYDALMRYFLNKPQLFVDELSSFLLVLVLFGGLAYTFQIGGHISVDLLTERLPPRPRAWLRLVTFLVGLAFLAVVTMQTWESAVRSYRMGRVSTVMLYPLYLPQFLIPAGLGLMFLAMLVALGRHARTLARHEPTRKEVSHSRGAGA